MEVEVVPAGVAADQLRRNSYSRSQQNDRRPGEGSPTRFSLQLHGSSRSVWRVAAATAAEVKGRANVFPL